MYIYTRVTASINSHLAYFQTVKAMRNAPGTHFNVCNKCSWLNTWHYGRSFPKTTGLPRHSWFSNLEEAANNSCQVTAHQLIIPAICFMSIVCKFTKVLPVIPCGKAIYLHGSVLMAVSLQFLWHFMVDWGVRIWFIYLFLSISESLL